MTDDHIDRSGHAGVAMTGDDGADGPKGFYILIEARPGREEDVVQNAVTSAPASRKSR